jgi:hypothetical protein
MTQLSFTYEELDMTVFKEKNGAMKAGGYLRRSMGLHSHADLPTFNKRISPHPRLTCRSAGEQYGLPDAPGVRAAATAYNGSIRKGG